MLTSYIALKCPAPQRVVGRSGWANFRTEEGTEPLKKFSLLFMYSITCSSFHLLSTLTAQGYFKAE